MGIEIARELSEMQGKLFELSGNLGYDSELFIKTFMRSAIAKGLDSKFDFMQWAGKEYIMERMEDEFKEGCVKTGKVYDSDVLYWIGYLYRHWHFYTGESSKEIYKIANASTLNKVYLGYHTLDLDMAIDRLKESKECKKKP